MIDSLLFNKNIYLFTGCAGSLLLGLSLAAGRALLPGGFSCCKAMGSKACGIQQFYLPSSRAQAQ